jgi:hypothetical protein
MIFENPAKSKYPPFIKDRFKNFDVHIVGSGPSLIGFDYSVLDGKRVITVNHAYKLVKSEFTVFIDKCFKREDPEIFNNTFTISRADCDPKPNIGFNMARSFSLDPFAGVYPYTRKNSGMSAITIALQGGAEKIYLYGFDHRFINAEQAVAIAEYNGTSLENDRSVWAHSTSGKFNHTRETPNIAETFANIVDDFRFFPRERIYNMSPFSVIPYFEKPVIPDKYQKFFS